LQALPPCRPSRASRGRRPIPHARLRLPEFQVSGWSALFSPKGTPKPILDKLTAALDKALDDDNSRKRLLDLGSEVPDKASRGQQELAALVKNEIARWTPIIKAANIKGE